MSQPRFQSLALSEGLVNNLTSLGYTTMTPVQAQSLPAILDGNDVIVQGETGSGKTAAFGLGLLSVIKPTQFDAQALVLCPTRELADQVATELRRLARSIPNIKVLTLCGGKPVGPQITSLKKGVHIVVGTPGRIEDHLKRQSLQLNHVRALVLDEADRMLQMGFQDSIDAIVEQLPKQRQTLLLSATYPSEIEGIAMSIMQQPQMVVAEAKVAEVAIEQYFYEVDTPEDRLHALCLLLMQHQPESALVFCTTKQDVQQVAVQLRHKGFSVLALHGDLDQRERDQNLLRFANRSVNVLVATDVAARGLDIDKLDVVVNFHLARDTEVHVHRIGRTGRAGESGLAWSFYHHTDKRRIEMFESMLDINICSESLPRGSVLEHQPPRAAMVTLQLEAGKKQKVRAGDILGALTGDGGVSGDQVGKINIFENRSYVAVQRQAVKRSLEKLKNGKLKGRNVRVRSL